MTYCHSNIIHIVEPECRYLKTNCEEGRVTDDNILTKIKLHFCRKQIHYVIVTCII